MSSLLCPCPSSRIALWFFFFFCLTTWCVGGTGARPLRLYQLRAAVNRLFEPVAQFLWSLRFFTLPAMIAYAVETADPQLAVSYSAVFLPPALPQ